MTARKRLRGPADLTTEQRWDIKVDQQSDAPCWRWIGAIGSGGYGNFMGDARRTVPAHRFAYERFVAPIPPGLDIDHVCRNRWCVNPEHLEAVTRRENSLRGKSPTMLLHHAGECAKGHKVEGANAVFQGGHWRCRTCRDEIYRRAGRRRTERRQAARVA